MRLSGEVMRVIDARAARAFSLYSDQAQFKGYAFQAHLVESQYLPGVLTRIDQIKEEKQSFERELPGDVRALCTSLCGKKWNWRLQAQTVQMETDYSFVYGYASRLLHAKPSSITTDQKNLTPDEVKVFLKYVHVRFLEMIEMGQQVLRSIVQH